MIFNLLYPKSVRCRQEQKNNMVILYQYANAIIFLCSRVSGQPSHATAPALMSLEATRTIVRGRQPRSGLMCILCKLMFLCSRGKRQAQTLYLMSLCPYVLLFPALAANATNKQWYGVSHYHTNCTFSFTNLSSHTCSQTNYL